MAMTTLEAYAMHGSVSYGLLEADRLRDILLGSPPVPQEEPRIYQALMEMPGKCAHDLAAELGLSYQQLSARTIDLCGQGLPQ